VGLLNACARIVALEEGRCAHEQIIKSGWDLDVFVGNFLIDIYAKRRSIDLESVQQHAIMRCGLQLEDAHALGMVSKFLNILNRYEKRVYSQMISHLVVFCQLVAMQVSWMKACAVVLNDHSLHDFCKIGKLYLHG